MFPILWRTEAGFIYGFTVAWVVGLALAFGAVWQMNREKRTRAIVDLFLACGAAALLTGRAAFVGLNWDYFGEALASSTRLGLGEIVNLGSGGYAYPGALLGALVAYAVVQRRLTLVVPTAAVVALWLAGWAACYLDGCAFGREAVAGPFVAPLADNFGVVALRYRTQAAGFVLSAVAGVVSWVVWRGPNRPIFVLLLLCAAHFFISFWRGDTMPTALGLRLDALLSLFVIAACALKLSADRLTS